MIVGSIRFSILPSPETVRRRLIGLFTSIFSVLFVVRFTLKSPTAFLYSLGAFAGKSFTFSDILFEISLWGMDAKLAVVGCICRFPLFLGKTKNTAKICEDGPFLEYSISDFL